MATMARRPAILAGGNWSLSAREKALSSTRLHVASPRYLLTLPSSTVVLARIDGSSSTYTHTAQVVSWSHRTGTDRRLLSYCMHVAWVVARTGGSSATACMLHG